MKIADPNAQAVANSRESALEKSLRLHSSTSMNGMYSKPSSDIVLEDAEKFLKFLTGETA